MCVGGLRLWLLGVLGVVVSVDAGDDNGWDQGEVHPSTTCKAETMASRRPRRSLVDVSSVLVEVSSSVSSFLVVASSSETEPSSSETERSSSETERSSSETERTLASMMLNLAIHLPTSNCVEFALCRISTNCNCSWTQFGHSSSVMGDAGGDTEVTEDAEY
jgi:hypothetical protein